MTHDPLVAWHEAIAWHRARLDALTWGNPDGSVFDSVFDSLHPRELTINARQWTRFGWFLWADDFTRAVPLVEGTNRHRRAPYDVVIDLVRGESSAMVDISVRPAPWARSDWRGSFIAVGAPAIAEITDLTRDDILRLVCWSGADDRWEGDTAGVAQLRNHAFVAWEASYGPTGDGFNRDAYGGNADIFFGATPRMSASMLSPAALELLAEWWTP
jgi:hypothetical protein